jgi:hypothetical protein
MDHASSHRRNVVQDCGMAGMRTGRQGEFDMGVDRLSGDGDERQTREGRPGRLTP